MSSPSPPASSLPPLPEGWAARYRLVILALVALAALGGLGAALSLPVALFPHVTYPRVVVEIAAGDRPAEQMAIDITRPAEAAVRSIIGVRNVRSTTSRGVADLSITFDWGLDMQRAALQINAALAGLSQSLPPGVTFTVRLMDPTVFPVAAYSLTSDSLDAVALRDIAQYQLVPLLSAIPGVAKVLPLGGAEREIHVEADPALLDSYGLTLNDLVQALKVANTIKALGRIEDFHKLYLILGDSRLKTLADIGAVIVKTAPDGVVRLAAVAEVTASEVPQWLIVNADGRRAVSVDIYQQPDSNTVSIVREVAARLKEIEPQLPENVTIRTWYDQSDLISTAALSVRDAILIGAGLAALVIVVFLRNVRITLAAMLAVPAVLATAVLMLKLLGMSFNIMTLGGMAAAVGLIIDDVIVMIEQIVRRVEEQPTATPAARTAIIQAAAAEFFKPLAGSSASTVIIFVPLAFLGGISGAFFKALSLTMASALIMSFLIAWLVVPLLANRLLRHIRLHEARTTGGGARLTGFYRRLLGGFFARRWLIAPLTVLILLIGFGAYSQIGTGFMPQMDEGGFVIDYKSPPGTSLADTDGLLSEVEAILKRTPEVATYSRRTGAQLGGGLTEANEGDFFVRLKPLPRRDIEAVMAEVRERVEREVPGLTIEMVLLMEDEIGDLTAVPQPIEIKLYSDGIAALLRTAPKIAALIGKVTGVVDVHDGIKPAGDAVEVLVDRTAAALEGLDPDLIGTQLEALLTGVVATQIHQGVKTVGIRVWTPSPLRNAAPVLATLKIRTADGKRVPLSRVATLRTVVGQPQITRDNMKPMIAVTARIEGRDMGSTVADIKRALSGSALIPPAMRYELGGLYAEQQQAFRGLAGVLVAAFALVFLLMLFLYRRVAITLAIMAMPLAALSAVFVGLWLTGVELNISAMMGMTMVVGIVTEIAIFYVSELEIIASRNASADWAATLIDAGVKRLRPIAMTTFATIFALLPLALGSSPGAQMQQPLAIAIISGLIVQMPLVLLVLPTLLLKLPDWKREHLSP